MTAARWHFDPQDTPEQRRTLRVSKSAQNAREIFPAGTPVAGRVGGQTGVVKRHVPGVNAQGGYLLVEWESGTTGRTQPAAITPIKENN